LSSAIDDGFGAVVGLAEGPRHVLKLLPTLILAVSNTLAWTGQARIAIGPARTIAENIAPGAVMNRDCIALSQFAVMKLTGVSNDRQPARMGRVVC
jgi:hypothetical protein